MTDEQRMIYQGALTIVSSSLFQEICRETRERDPFQKAIEIAHSLFSDALELGSEE